MNLELITLLNKRSRRFESPDIGPVSKLCLSVASNNLRTRAITPVIYVRDAHILLAVRRDPPSLIALVSRYKPFD